MAAARVHRLDRLAHALGRDEALLGQQLADRHLEILVVRLRLVLEIGLERAGCVLVAVLVAMIMVVAVLAAVVVGIRHLGAPGLVPANARRSRSRRCRW